jgi:hypothetical protein
MAMESPTDSKADPRMKKEDIRGSALLSVGNLDQRRDDSAAWQDEFVVSCPLACIFVTTQRIKEHFPAARQPR